MNLQNFQQRVQGVVTAGFPVLLAYLFGSRASGQATPQSDYDLGILLDRKEDSPALRARLSHELTAIFETDTIDVVWLNQAPPELAFAVIQRHLLYERNLATRIDYEACVMGRYYDYLPYLRAQRADILSGGGPCHPSSAVSRGAWTN